MESVTPCTAATWEGGEGRGMLKQQHVITHASFEAEVASAPWHASMHTYVSRYQAVLQLHVDEEYYMSCTAMWALALCCTATSGHEMYGRTGLHCHLSRSAVMLL